MNVIAKNTVAKLAVAFVAVSMLLMLATPAKAATVEELEALIAQLTAQIAALSGGGSPSADACTFTRSLSDGSEGADVTCLQDYLTPTYFNFAGGSTGYFGPVTTAAVAAWQAAHGVAPAVGYFGPVSQAKYNELMAAMPPADDSDDDMSDDSDDMDDDSDMSLSGEAVLKSFDIEDGDDTELEEGQTEDSVLEFYVEFEDGDALISRLDVTFDTDSLDDIWDVLGDVTLYVDGDEVASLDGSDEDEYRSDDMTLRFSGLDIWAGEDEEVLIEVGVEVQDRLDDTSHIVSVTVPSMRFIDGDDVTTTESNPSADTGQFTIAAAGSEDELIVKSNSDDPESTTLIVDDGTLKSDWYTVFVFDLDTDDSINDIELNHVGVEVALTNGADAVQDVVQDAEIVIDGDTYDDWDWSGLGGIDFDIDGDHSIDAGDRVAVEVNLRFFGIGSGVDEGQTFTVSASTTLFDAEGVEDVTATGAAVSEEHTLRSAGLVPDASSVETSETTSGTDDTTGIFEISFDVTALEGDFYVATTGVAYTIDGPAAPTGDSWVLTSTGVEDTTDVFTVREGETETFTLTVTVDASATGLHRVSATSISFTDNPDGVTGLTVQDLLPASDYRTDYENINI